MKSLRGITRSVVMAVTMIVAVFLSAQTFAAKAPPAQPVNLNSATADELMTIPGIGASKAQAIVTYRSQTPFSTPEDLVNVKGIGEKMFAKIAPYVTVQGGQATPPAGTAKKAN